jgi:hypothetical protein
VKRIKQTAMTSYFGDIVLWPSDRRIARFDGKPRRGGTDARSDCTARRRDVVRIVRTFHDR